MSRQGKQTHPQLLQELMQRIEEATSDPVERWHLLRGMVLGLGMERSRVNANTRDYRRRKQLKTQALVEDVPGGA